MPLVSTFQKDDGTVRTGIYHSDLTYHTQNGAQPIVLTAAPRKSRYPGKPSYVKLRVPPDPHEYQLSIEHDGIEAVLAQLPLNVPVNVQAIGSRETAVLEVAGGYVPAPAPQQQQRAVAQPQQQQPQAASYPGAVLPTRQQQEAAQLPFTHAYYRAFMAAHAVANKVLIDCGDAFVRITPGEKLEFTRNIATSFFIQAQQQPDRPLQGNGQPKSAAAAPPPPAPAPRPQPAAAQRSPFEDDPDDPDGLPF